MIFDSYFDLTELYTSFNFNFFPKIFTGLLKSYLEITNQSSPVVKAFWFLFSFVFLVNRVFLKVATNFSLNKSIKFEGSYDHLKPAKF